MSVSLVCLPFAGSGAGFYRAWGQLHVEGVRVLAPQLPGREELFLDRPYTDISQAAGEVAQQVLGMVSEDGPVALFGHCLGALLAFEIARELESLGTADLRHLFVSGCAAPWSARPRPTSALDDEAFVAYVTELTGYRHAALDDPELREVLLPLLRADMAMFDDYRPSSATALSIPVTSIRGATDAIVSRERSEAWREATTSRFASTELPGGHMYVTDSAEQVLQIVAGSMDHAH